MNKTVYRLFMMIKLQTNEFEAIKLSMDCKYYNKALPPVNLRTEFIPNKP